MYCKDNQNEILIRKTKGRGRSITNLKLIKGMIREIGYAYNEIYFEDKNPKEQIESIMNSKIIISPHGAGLTNMIWIISSKSLIIEWFSPSFTQNYMRLISTFGT